MNEWMQVLTNAATYAINHQSTLERDHEAVSRSDRGATPSSPLASEDFVLDNDPDEDR